MLFTQVPNQHAPIGGVLRYAVETGAEKKTVAVTVVQTLHGTTLARKRFVKVTEAQFDIAPYVRRAVKFKPQAGPTGVYAPDGRIVEVVVEAAAEVVVEAAAENKTGATKQKGTVEVEPAETPDTVVAPARQFLPGMFAVAAPAILTEMPRHRMIGPAEADELTLLTTKGDSSSQPDEVVVTATGTKQIVARYALSNPGIHLFRLDMRDFPGAESVCVDVGGCETVDYTVVAAPEGARRVAWRSRAGSIEHYTFPEETTTVVETQKTRAYSPEGYVAAAREGWRMELVSAYEAREVLETLSGIISSPQVWLATQSGYKPVDVLTKQSVVYRNGVMSRMELALRPARKTTLPWN